MYVHLSWYLALSAILFTVGVVGVIIKRNIISMFMCIELMLNAANLNFIAFWRFSEHPEALTGIMFVIFSIGVAAAEAAVGLALIIAIYLIVVGLIGLGVLRMFHLS